MNTSALVAIAAAGFALGAVLGRPEAAPSANMPRSRQPVADADAESSRPALQPSSGNPDDDERWTRLVSALHEPLHLRQRALLADALGDFTAADMAAAIARAEKLPRIRREEIIEALAARWFELDPDAAARWSRKRMTAARLCMWARQQPEIVLREIETLPSAEVAWREGGLDRIIAPTPREQAAVLQSLPAGKMRDRLLFLTLERWAADDAPAAWARAGSLPAGELRARAEKQTLLVWAKRDPASAVALARTLLPSQQAGLCGDPFVTDLTASLAGRDPAAARQWVAELPGAFRPTAAAAVARTWAATEPIAALEWMRAQGLEVARDIPTDGRWNGTVLREAMTHHPAETAAWVLALLPGEARDGLLENAALIRTGRLPPNQTNTGAEPWMRATYRAMPAESQARIARLMGDKSAALREP